MRARLDAPVALGGHAGAILGGPGAHAGLTLPLGAAGSAMGGGQSSARGGGAFDPDELIRGLQLDDRADEGAGAAEEAELAAEEDGDAAVFASEGAGGRGSNDDFLARVSRLIHNEDAVFRKPKRLGLWRAAACVPIFVHRVQAGILYKAMTSKLGQVRGSGGVAPAASGSMVLMLRRSNASARPSLCSWT
jgi:hypothetical protein